MAFLDEAGLQRVRDDINKIYKRKESIVGTISWFTGNTGQIPTGYLVCNGQAVSRTTYANLFAVIGTKYGVGDGSTTFNLPDLSDGNGRFIRAGFTDSVIGTKQNDAIRNITGRFSTPANGQDSSQQVGEGGAFSYGTCSGRNWRSGESATVTQQYFNADNNYASYGNPMTGHANGNDIHPYDIYLLPLIAY